MSKLLLSPAHQAFLDATTARNRALYGGWFMDASGSGDGGGGDGGATGATGDTGATGADGNGTGGGDTGSGRNNATDGQGNDLGFPKNTPVAEMSDKEQVAYWRNNSRKHEGLWKDLTGDRSIDDVKKDLTAFAEHQRSQQTPAEQQLADARNEGKQEGIKSVRSETAMATFRGALEANGVTGDDLDEIVANFNVNSYIGDDGVDTTKIVTFAKKFTQSDTDDTSQQQRRRNFGGGDRGNSGTGTTSVKQVMEQRRAAREANK